MYGQLTQKSMDEPGIVTIPAHRWITRENYVFPVPVRACETGFAGRVRPSYSASARSPFSTLRLNLVLPTKASTYIPPTATGLATILSDHAIACLWCSLPRVRWHSACTIPLSTMRYVKRKKYKAQIQTKQDSFSYQSSPIVRRNGGGRGLCGGPGKRVDGVFPRRSQIFRHQRRPVDDCSPGRGVMGNL